MIVGVDGRNLSRRLTGIARYVSEMCRALVAAGVDVRLYMPEAPYSTFADIADVKWEIGSNKGAIARAVWSKTTLPRLANRDKVDLFWGPAHRLPPFLSKFIPRVLTIHDLVWLKAAETMHPRTLLGERLSLVSSLDKADVIVADSNATARDLVEHFPKLKAPIQTVYPGANNLPAATRLDLKTLFGIDRPYALSIGTQEPRKNLLSLLKAYAACGASTRSGCMLVIAGGTGWGKDDLKSQAPWLGIEDDVRFLGYVTDQELAALYANCQFLALPSLYEGFGLPIAEANSFGAPVLTSNCSCMPEIAGDAALLVDPHNVGSISDGFKRLAEDDHLRADLAANAKANAARFDWRSSAAELIGAFEKAQRLRRQQ